MRALCLASLDPAYNLACEEYLCQTITPEHPGWILLWRNAPSIIVGRFQNTAAEVSAAFVAAHHLPVVRRMTGGGAVYHDAGNLNFSFIVPRRADTPWPELPFADFSFRGFLQPILAALADLGVKAELSGRNDIMTHGAKCSGSAQHRTRNVILHHGTLLVDLDMDRLASALAVDPEKYRSRGLASVRSRVTNLRPYLPEGVGMDAIRAAILTRCGHACTGGDLSAYADVASVIEPQTEAAVNALADAKYRTWEWNYGTSPAFDEVRGQRFAWGKLEMHLRTEQGIITDCRFQGDFFAAMQPETVAARLVGVRNHPDDIKAALHDAPLALCFTGCEPHAVIALLAGEGAVPL